jgi:2-oxoglutarate ferredoxin oxidoreductase subunit alpha
LEAARLAIRFMTPVIVLTDGHLAQSAESWRVRDWKTLPPIETNGKAVRRWVVPGAAGDERQVGGLEHSANNGSVSFDPANHEQMVTKRAAKIAHAADTIAPLEVTGPATGELLVLGWGSTLGAIHAAAERCRCKGLAVANAHLRHLSPMPKNTGDVLEHYRRILVPELNSGQLAQVLRSQFDVDIVSLPKKQGRPFLTREIEDKIESVLSEKKE